MKGLTRKIDARGLPCPGPVVACKKALEEGGFDILEVVVDNPTARDNVTRFAAHSGQVVEGTREEGDSVVIRIRRTQGAAVHGEDAACAEEAPATPKEGPGPRATTILLSSDTIGKGSDELGSLLMKGFIGTLLEADRLPACIILMNSGVGLAVGDSPALVNLIRLADLGVEILACGTCLDYYGLKEKLAVGRVSNMFEISGRLLEGSTLSL